MKRSKHNLSHYRLHTAKMGELFPITCIPVIPGDTFQHSTSVLVRAAPLNTPVMHPVNVRIHHWFVPNRIIFDGWEDFITGGPDGLDATAIPKIPEPNGKKSVLTYLGMPWIEGANYPETYNAMPLYAYNKIWNQRYRDQDLTSERQPTNQNLASCAWEKDYFTTARPWTQKGPQITVPVGNTAPIISDGTSPEWADLGTGDSAGFTANSTSQGIKTDGADVAQDLRFGESTGLLADLSNSDGVDVNTFREAFALQRYQEARARYGSRFTEYLRYLGIKPSDARLQEPEYLGGGVQRLQFSEVLQTTPALEEDTAGVGDLYGHGIAGVKTPRYRKFFEEHGYVITLCSIRPKSLYLNAMPREFLKTDKEHYYQKELVHLGQQAIMQPEINGAAEKDTVFGYQDRYDEYRQHPSLIGQDFKDLLSSWHLGRDIDKTQALNNSFVQCAPSDRIFQVQTNDNMWVMANHRIVARRLLPKRSNPRIL